MAEWKQYTGSDDQLRELNIGLGSSGKGVLLRLSTGKEIIITAGLYAYKFTHYLICDPHPLREMIKQQADTGQPVWVRYEWRDSTGPNTETFVTNTPDWDIPNARYSLTSFDETTTNK